MSRNKSLSKRLRQSIEAGPAAELVFDNTSCPVSFETSIGKILKPGEVLDIDEQALLVLQEVYKFQPEDKSKLSIEYIGPKSRKISRSASGEYDGEDHTLTIRVPGREPEDMSEAQKILQHELYHAKRDFAGYHDTETTFDRLKRDYSFFADRLAVPTGALGVVALTSVALNEFTGFINVLDSEEIKLHVTETGIAAFVASAALALVYKKYYHDDPEERYARAAELLTMSPSLVIRSEEVSK